MTAQQDDYSFVYISLFFIQLQQLAPPPPQLPHQQLPQQQLPQLPHKDYILFSDTIFGHLFNTLFI